MTIDFPTLLFAVFFAALICIMIIREEKGHVDDAGTGGKDNENDKTDTI